MSATERAHQAPDLKRILDIFHAESEEGLAAMEEALVHLEAQPDDAEAIGAVFRVVHTLKGSASMVGAPRIVELAHGMETAFDLVRAGELPLVAAHVSLLLQTVDLVRQCLRDADMATAAPTAAHRRQLALLDVEHLRRLGDPAAGEDAGASSTASSAGAELPASARAAVAHRRTLRVDMARLDALMDLTGEIAIARGRLFTQLAPEASGPREDARQAADELGRLFVALQEQVMQLRLVPLGPVLRQSHRVVRDAAGIAGKLARLELAGEEVEVDAAIVDHLRDPLTHMLRNAVDHGLEHPATRVAAGKHPCGTITIRAWQEQGTINLRVEDDGAGLDRERILARARARGLMDASGTPTDAEVLRCITAPGFSTAEAVTQLSGRGVGMDVVRRNVEALRGSVAVESTRGRGTAFLLRMPLTLAIIQGLTVQAGEETLVVPVDAVSECLHLPADAQEGGDGTGVMSLRGEPLPYARLRSLLDVQAAAPRRENVVVVHHAGQRVGLVVDQLLGQQETVVKPLGGIFRGVPGVAGATILGSGRVALIVDVPTVMQRIAGASRALAPPA